MKTIMVMFDTLNRRFLQPYGCEKTITPNFLRLAEKTARFDNCYAGSLPCIPARRELHTGRYNFLHRSWGPLEPFDDSMPQILKSNGIHSCLISDHGHYWECGGATYHTAYSTWQNVRGEEGDAYKASIGEITDDAPNFTAFTEGLRKDLYTQNLANRTVINKKEDFPLVKTFNLGIDFIKENKDKDSWFLQIESFSPHEPFMATKDFKKLYSCESLGKRYEWPDYAPVNCSKEEVEKVKLSYFASLSMCDEQLGRLLDLMDKENMWEDTMLIVNTDHGYLLGEHGYFAKNYMPCYDEIVHIPLFIYDPRVKKCKGSKHKELVQTVDIPVTILKAFGLNPTPDMAGKDIEPVLEKNETIRENGLFGTFGGHICITDGKFVYMRAPRDTKKPIYEYTLMPTHMMEFFSNDELKSMQRHDPFDFTKDCPVMQIATDPSIRCVDSNDYLFDLSIDPTQMNPIKNETVEKCLINKMVLLMKENDAPKEIYERFDLV